MKVVVISRQNVKPSCPTPEHQRHLKLSFLDQITNQNVVPWIYYYEPEHISRFDKGITNTERCARLKKSLSETLTKFYPLAGRLREKDNLFDCNDEGVPFLIARVESQLSRIVGQVNNNNSYTESLINKLLPSDLRLEDAGDLLLSIQVNIFDCGGMAIGVCFSHKIADALSTITFNNCWAATSRGGAADHSSTNVSTISPRFDMATLFPPMDMSGYKERITGIITNEKIVARMFKFSAFNISALVAKYTIEDGTQKKLPTRVEALTTFICNRLMAATKGDEDEPAAKSEGSLCVVVQAMDLRTRANPPLPTSSFGNLSRFTTFVTSREEITTNNEGGHAFLTQMRDAINKINGDYVRKFQESSTQVDFIEKQQNLKHKVEMSSYIFTSLIRIPLYDADFGWGRPTWVSPAILPFKNIVTFMPTKSGFGVEAWIFMKEDDIAKLEADEQFLAFVSPTSDG